MIKLQFDLHEEDLEALYWLLFVEAQEHPGSNNEWLCNELMRQIEKQGTFDPGWSA